ncbi:P-loop NTPase fold protein [Micromonospora sp. NPDC005171]|uniref:KAP family P-loop NTPase fold protein n=1 Tax=Micromonospora sp. NPDC005171 TaxID=3156866 RepID=UPI0033AB2CAD
MSKRRTGITLNIGGGVAVASGVILWTRAWEYILWPLWQLPDLGQDWRWLALVLVLGGTGIAAGGILLLRRAKMERLQARRLKWTISHDSARDDPIGMDAEDLLSRVPVAASLAKQLRAIQAPNGYVVAVMGPWGSGKTSLINLTRRRLEEDPVVPVLEFNPWMFSGAEQLVEIFFREIAGQLRLKEGRLAAISSEIETYGQLLSPFSSVPVAGPWIGRIANAAGAVAKFSNRRTATEVRDALSDKLAALETPLIVMIDDIDRLLPEEVRDVFKLVRLTASFPNVVYVLIFDRPQVERSLDRSGVEGRAYIEKIVQLPIDLPSVPGTLLLNQLGRALQDALDDVEVKQFDRSRWPDVLAEVIYPLVVSMRGVRQYGAAVRGTLDALGDQIEAVDVLGLEAVRIFMPDVFAAIAAARRALTAPSPSGARDSHESEFQRLVEGLLEVAGENREIVRSIIERLFPASLHRVEGPHNGSEWLAIWLRARRVAHLDVLNFYLERHWNAGIHAFADAERAFSLLADRSGLEDFLNSLDEGHLEDVVAALRVYEEDFPVEAVPVATVVLLNLLPKMPPSGRGGLFVVEPRTVVSATIRRLLRRLPDQDAVGEVVANILPGITSLSSRLQLVDLVSSKDSVRGQLASKSFIAELEAAVCDAVDQSTTDSLLEEWDLLRLLAWAQRKSGKRRALAEVDHVALNAKLLLLARTERVMQTMGDRAVVREARLHWDTLLNVYGGEEKLRRAVELLKGQAAGDAALAEVVELADKYLSGWKSDD